MITVLILILFAAAVAGMVMSRGGNETGKLIAIACSVVAILLAIGRIASNSSAPSNLDKLVNELEILEEIQAEFLGRHLAETKAGANAVCLLNRMHSYNDQVMKGLQTGLGTEIPVHFVYTDDSDVPGGSLDFEVSPAVYAWAIDEQPGADLLICISVPASDQMQIARLLRDRDVRVAIINAYYLSELEPFRRAGVLAGATLSLEDPVPFSEVKKGTPQEIFDSRYKLIPGV